MLLWLQRDFGPVADDCNKVVDYACDQRRLMLCQKPLCQRLWMLESLRPSGLCLLLDPVLEVVGIPRHPAIKVCGILLAVHDPRASSPRSSGSCRTCICHKPCALFPALWTSVLKLYTMSAATNARGWKICKVLHTDTSDCPNQAKTFSNVHLHTVVFLHHHLHTIVFIQ